MKINDEIFDYYGEDEGLTYKGKVLVFIGVISDYFDILLRYVMTVLVIFGTIDYVDIILFDLPTNKIWFGFGVLCIIWVLNAYVLNYIFSKYSDCFSDD